MDYFTVFGEENTSNFVLLRLSQLPIQCDVVLDRLILSSILKHNCFITRRCTWCSSTILSLLYIIECFKKKRVLKWFEQEEKVKARSWQSTWCIIFTIKERFAWSIYQKLEKIFKDHFKLLSYSVYTYNV